MPKEKSEEHMSYEANRLDDICTRFNGVQWHDSKLTAFQLLPKDNNQRYDITFDLRLLTNAKPGSYDWQQRRLEIEECRIIRLNLDMLGMQLCGGDIGGAFCEKANVEDAQIQGFDLPQGDNPLADLVRFRVLLVPPGGEINVFAKNFKLSPPLNL